MKLLGLLAAGTLFAMAMTASAAESSAPDNKAQSAAMKGMMINMMKQQAAKSCGDEEMLSCMEVSKSDCESMMNGVVDKCMAPNMDKLMASKGMSAEARDALNKQIENCATGVTEEYGVDPEDTKKCSPGQASAK